MSGTEYPDMDRLAEARQILHESHAIRKSALEEAASLVESFSAGQIRLAAGEMSAQEMRVVKAVQAWWAAAIRHKAV